MVVLISLLTAGLKLRTPLRHRRWVAPVLLATVAMALTVGLVTAIGVLALGLPLGRRDRARRRARAHRPGAGLGRADRRPVGPRPAALHAHRRGRPERRHGLPARPARARPARRRRPGPGRGALDRRRPALGRRRGHRRRRGARHGRGRASSCTCAATDRRASAATSCWPSACWPWPTAARSSSAPTASSPSSWPASRCAAWSGARRRPTTVRPSRTSSPPSPASPKPRCGDETAPASMAHLVLRFSEQLERAAEAVAVVVIGVLLLVVRPPLDAIWFVPLLLVVVRPLAVLATLLPLRPAPPRRPARGVVRHSRRRLAVLPRRSRWWPACWPPRTPSW